MNLFSLLLWLQLASDLLSIQTVCSICGKVSVRHDYANYLSDHVYRKESGESFDAIEQHNNDQDAVRETF